MKFILQYKIVLLFYHLPVFIIKEMAKLRKTLTIRITESQFRYILEMTKRDEKSKSKIIREAIQKHLVNGKNR